VNKFELSSSRIFLRPKIENFIYSSSLSFSLIDVSVNPSPGIRFEMYSLILVSKLSALEFETKPKLKTKN
jgi:hypothetical protein